MTEGNDTAQAQKPDETMQGLDIISPDDAADTNSGAQKSKGSHFAEAPVKEHKVGKTIAKVFGVLVALVAIVYLGGVAAFSFVFMPNTTLGNEDVSLTTFSDAAQNAVSRTGSYTTTVTSGEYSTTLTGEAIGLSIDKDTYQSGLAAQQNAWTWPAHITESHALVPAEGISLDSSKLTEALRDSITTFNETATQPTDATIGYVESEGGFAVIPEVAGTALNIDSTVAYIAEQISGLPSSIALDSTCLVQPTVTSTDQNLITAAENANVFLTADIPLTLGGMDAGSVTKEQISDWIILGDDLSATLDEEKLATWVKENIAAKFDTAGSARTYTRPDGKVVTVDAATNYWGNYYGWITDEEELVTLITEAVKSGSTETIDIPTKQTAATVPDENGRDWGNRYIDCDLTEQYVRLYDDSGECVWESYCVTGNTSTGYNTPAGIYFLNSYRASGDVELRGKIDPSTGEPEYISHVAYWMPFINNSYAFHDASWRSNFGGSIYTYGGSHGCVNLPSSKAAELYSLCQVGDCVVVHY